MADRPASERSERPTPERLRRARRQGRVPVSNEIPSALMVAGLLLVLALAGPVLLGGMSTEVRQGMSYELGEGLDSAGLAAMLQEKLRKGMGWVLPFLLAGLAISVLGSLLVGGWAFAPRLVSPDFNRISPAQGLKNLLSLRAFVHLLVSLAKLALVLGIVYFYLRDRLQVCTALRHAGPHQSLVAMCRLVFGLIFRVAVGLLALGAADAFFQRWKYRRDLRMTRQELKEEIREHELSPHVRSRLRSLQIALARRRMMQEVPAADLVLTNPTHVAVALRYEAETMDAPQVVAKGADFLAEKIKEIARTHEVPIVERPELARTLYDTVEVGQAIPESLYLAVAEVLAMIYRLRNKRLAGAGGASGE